MIDPNTQNLISSDDGATWRVASHFDVDNREPWEVVWLCPDALRLRPRLIYTGNGRTKTIEYPPGYGARIATP